SSDALWTGRVLFHHRARIRGIPNSTRLSSFDGSTLRVTSASTRMSPKYRPAVPGMKNVPRAASVRTTSVDSARLRAVFTLTLATTFASQDTPAVSTVIAAPRLLSQLLFTPVGLLRVFSRNVYRVVFTRWCTLARWYPVRFGSRTACSPIRVRVENSNQ